MSLEIGSRVGRYEIRQKLGSGGMGEVWVAEDSDLGREIALKILLAELATDADRLQRFEAEAKTLATLNHPNIVTIHSVEEIDGLRFITMELIDGQTLAEAIPAGGLGLDRFLELAVPLADGVRAAHQRSVSHRDLKPTNVMITADGRLKILDFGLALVEPFIDSTDGLTQLKTSTITADGKIVGTVSYMSPEQAEGHRVDHRSDIFSLGILLYEMLTGERPFRGDTTISVLSSILKETPTALTETHPTLPLPLARVVQRALEKNPDKRYQSAADLRQDLENIRRDMQSGELLSSGLYASGLSHAAASSSLSRFGTPGSHARRCRATGRGGTRLDGVRARRRADSVRTAGQPNSGCGDEHRRFRSFAGGFLLREHQRR